MQQSQDELFAVNRIVSQSPVIVFIWQFITGWPVVFVSSNVVNWMGYTPDDFISGRVDYANIIHPDDFERVEGEVLANTSMPNRNYFAHEPYRIISKNGHIRWFDDRTNILRDQDGKITQLEGVLLDITERKIAEDLIHENEKKLNSFSYNIPGMIYIGNRDWTVNIISNCLSISGYSIEEFLQQKIKWIDLIHPDDRKNLVKPELEIYKRPTSIVQEYRIITKEGRVKFVSDHKTSKFTPDNVFDGVDGIVFDITEKKKAEQELIVAKDIAEQNEFELKERVKELNGIFNLGLLTEMFENIDDIYSEFITRIVPESMRFPNLVWAGISIDNKIFSNRNTNTLPSGNNCLKADIEVFGKKVGELVVAYLQVLPFIEDYEQNLIKTYAQRISYFTERRVAILKLKQQNDEYAELNKKLSKAITTIEESERKFKDIFDFTGDSILVANAQGIIQLANISVCDLFDYQQSDLIRSSILELFKKEYDFFFNLFLDAESKISKFNEVPMTKRDGTVFYADITATPITINGELMVLCSIKDISERKQMQQRIIRTIIETEEKERKRVAQEIHDGIGPILSTIKLLTETYLHSDNDEYKIKVSTQLLTSIDEALDQVSIISNNLSPQILVDFGLKIAIRKFIEKLIRVVPLSIQFSYGIDGRLSNEIEITIYRVIIELINNTVKHAQAKNISITIKTIDHEVHMEYYDDGVGFDYNKALEKISGMGLFNIQHRVKSLNGEIEFYNEGEFLKRFLIKLPNN
jgi:PAS domain S-box-containing protein